MPVPAMAPPIIDHQRRFQAAVDVIQNLPKNGSYRPSYEMMLRFYSLYKQAMCGPCSVPRPGFLDPVGRYKWDAWSSLGEMSKVNAMAAYVDEMKNIAQEVINTTPMNEKTASLFHHFEPLYLVIDDMPRPPVSLLDLSEGSKHASRPEITDEDKKQSDLQEDPSLPDGANTSLDQDLVEFTANSRNNECGASEGLVLTSDSESEIFCDSVETVDLLSCSSKVPAVESVNIFHTDHVLGSTLVLNQQLEGPLKVRQAGAGQGGEGAEDRKSQGLSRRSQNVERENSCHNWRDRGVPQRNPSWGAPEEGGGSEAGRGGGGGSEDRVQRLHDTQLQQQIVAALRRLREDMKSVMDRLEVVERLAATHDQSSDWTVCLRCSAKASQQQEGGWWPFDVSAHTIVLFLLWPFVAQGLVYFLKKTQRRSSM